MRQQRPWPIAAFTAAVLAVAGCGGNGAASADPGPTGSATPSSGLRADATELVFSGVRGAPASRPQTVTVHNGQSVAQSVTVTLTGPAAEAFVLDAPVGDWVLEAGASVAVPVRFAPRTTVGSLAASLTVTGDGAVPLAVGLYGLAAVGEQGRKEPPLSAVLTTLGHPVDVGGTGLILGNGEQLLGAEVAAPLFRAVSDQPVTLLPVARYSPDEPLPYGWYRPDPTGLPEKHPVGVLAEGQEQTLNPQHTGPTTLEGIGTQAFGLFVHSDAFGRDTFTQDQLNTGPTRHAVRVFPLHERSGAPVPHGFVVTFEDKANGDYQDHVYLLRGVEIAGA